MTRLTSGDIQDIPYRLESCDQELVRITGRDLIGIACHAAGIDRSIAASTLKTLTVASIPFSCGEGIIGNFCEADACIATHLGCKASTTRKTDASGIAEALALQPDLLLMADDNRFVAADIQCCHLIDNAAATGCGYAAGLDLMAKGVKDKTVLVTGCGAVGCRAAATLAAFGARVGLYDINRHRCEKAAAELASHAATAPFDVPSLPPALERCRLMVEASTAPQTIPTQFIYPDTYIAAPGMPLGLSHEARTAAGRRLLHDPLQIGVATMLVLAVAKRLEVKNK